MDSESSSPGEDTVLRNNGCISEGDNSSHVKDGDLVLAKQYYKDRVRGNSCCLMGGFMMGENHRNRSACKGLVCRTSYCTPCQKQNINKTPLIKSNQNNIRKSKNQEEKVQRQKI